MLVSRQITVTFGRMTEVPEVCFTFSRLTVNLLNFLENFQPTIIYIFIRIKKPRFDSDVVPKQH